MDVSRSLDWANERETKRVIKFLGGSVLATLALVYIVPIRYLVMMAGVGIVVSNTPVARAMWGIVPSLVGEMWRSSTIIAKEDVGVDVKNGGDGRDASDDGSVVVVENQRWWAGEFIKRPDRCSRVYT